MKDFCEAVLTLNVRYNLAEVYKRAIETENYPNGLTTHWNGVYAFVEIGKSERVNQNGIWMETANVQLTIQLLSHNIPNLKQVVDWYERTGCEIDYKNYREESK